MFRLHLLIFISALAISCERRNERVETFYPSGQINTVKEYLTDEDTTDFYITYYREDGTLICEGEKFNDNKRGQWKYYNEENVIESVENFCDGLLCDTQKYYFPNGNIRLLKILDQDIACFCDTPCTFSYTLKAYWANGNLREESYFRNCEFHGTTCLYDSLSNTLSYEINYFDGIKDGSYKKFYLDGSVMKGQYEDGEPVGHWTTKLGDSLISEKHY